jgi:hypothetical protein
MTISIIESDVEADIDTFRSLLNRNREKTVDNDRFNWLYLNNPHGKAKVWCAVDEQSGKTIAFTCALPRLMKINGSDLLCWNCGDFSVDKKFRTLGVALKLRRAAKNDVDQGVVNFLYAHPNNKMEVIHKRVGHFCIGKMQRYVKLIRVNSLIQKKIGSRNLTDFFSFFLNPALSSFDFFMFKKEKQFQKEWVSGKKFDQSYDDLFKKVSPNYKIIGDRSSKYLNWRYHNNPLYKTKRITIRKNNELLGFIVFYVKNDIAVFKDMLVMPDKRILNSIVGFWIKELRTMNINQISAIFKNHGFYFRPEEESSVYVYANKNNESYSQWIDGDNWYMTVGDRDV